MNKTISYILIGVGALTFILSYPSIRTILGLPLLCIQRTPPQLPLCITDVWVMIAGIVLILLGAFLGFRSSSKQAAEVPIYHGDKIVGYRRMAK